MNKDEIEGTAHKVVGQAEAAIGDAVGNTQSSVSGRFPEARGDAQAGIGQIKNQVGEAAARLGARTSDRAIQGNES